MNAIHVVTSSTTQAAEIAAELYDVYRGAKDPDAHLHAFVTAAIEDLNSSGPYSVGAVVETPRLARVPFRIPPEAMAGLYVSFQKLGITDIGRAGRMSLHVAMQSFQDAAVPVVEAEVDDALRICRLMHIEGLDRATAHAMITTPGSGIRSVADLAAMPQADLRSLLETLGTIPQTVLDAKEPQIPFSLQARRLSHVPRRRRHAVLPHGPGVARLAALEATWEEEAESPARTAQERASAQAMATALRLQRLYTRAAVAAEQARWRPALRALAELQGAIDTLTAASSPGEASLRTIITEVGDLLMAIDERDLEAVSSTLGRTGQPTVRRFRTKHLSQTTDPGLGAPPRAYVEGDVGASSTPVHALGRASFEPAVASLAELDPNELATSALGLGLAPASLGVRTLDRLEPERVQIRQNAAAALFSGLAANVVGAALEEARLPDVAKVFDPAKRATFPAVRDALSAYIQDLLPGDLDDGAVLFDHMDVFDPFVSFTPGSDGVGPTFYAPLNAHFTERYIAGILHPFQKADAAILRAATLRDPASFLLSLPILLADPIPKVQARALTAVGAGHRATALLAGAGIRPSESLPTGAYFHVDAYAPDPGTHGASYTQLRDQGGQSRHFTASSGGAPPVSGTPFPSARGSTVLPQPSSTQYLRYQDPAAIAALGDFTGIDWGPYTLELKDHFGMVATGAGELAIAGVGQPSGGSVVVRAGTLDLAPPSPVTLPQSGSADAWLVKAYRRVVVGSVATWRLVIVGDLDDGNGPQLLTDQTWTETGSTSGAPQAALDDWRGARMASGLQSGREVGGGVFYPVGLDDDALVAGVVAGANRFGALQESAAAKLLGHALPGVDVDVSIADRERFGSISFGTPNGDATLPEFFMDRYRYSNQLGDDAYVRGHYAEARAHYEYVLEDARVESELAEFLDSLELALDNVHTRVANGERPRLLRYAAFNSATGETRNLFSGSRLRPGGVRRTGAFGGPRAELYQVITTYERIDDSADFDALDREQDAPSIDRTLLDFELGRDLGVGAVPPSFAGSGAAEMVMVDADLVEFELFYAVMRLRQLGAGLNFLGLDPDTVPMWSYGRLRAAALEAVSQVESLQQQALTLTRERDREAYELVDAAHAVEAARGLATVQEKEVERSIEGRRAAEHAKEVAEKKKNLFLNPGTVAWLKVIAAIGAAVVSTVLAVVTFGGAAPVAVAAWAGVVGATAGVVGAAAHAGSTTKRVKKDIKAAQLGLDTANAIVTHAIAEEAHALGAVSAAEQHLQRLMDDEVNTLDGEAYQELAQAVEAIAESLMRRAHRLAWLAERALMRESLTYSGVITQRYLDRFQPLSRFYSASALAAALDELEAKRVFAASRPVQTIKTTFSMLATDPTTVVQLQTQGEGLLRIDQSHIDERFPGTYLHQLRRVEIDFDGLVAPGEVRATLFTSANSRARVPNRAPYVRSPGLAELDGFFPEAEYSLDGTGALPMAPFVTVPVLSLGGTQVLSEYRRGVDGTVLASPPGALDALEHHSTDIFWALKLSGPGNDFDFGDIRDVRVTLYFSAEYDLRLRERQEAVWSSTELTRGLVMSAAASDPAGLRSLTSASEPGEPGYRAMVTLPIEPEAMPQGLASPRFLNLALHFTGVADGLGVRVSHPGHPFGASATTDPSGEVFSAHGDADVDVTLDDSEGPVTIYTSRAATFPRLDNMARILDQLGFFHGDVRVKVLAEDNPAFQARDDDNAMITRDVEELVFSDPAQIATTTTEWTDFHVECFIGNDPGTYTIDARKGASDPANMTVTVGGTGEIQGVVFDQGSASPSDPGADSGYLLGVRVIGDQATFYVDRQVVGQATLTGTGAGAVQLRASSGVFRDLRIQPLTSAGAAMGPEILESFADASRVRLEPELPGPVPPPTVQQTPVPVLDLGVLDDITVMVDFATRFAT